MVWKETIGDHQLGFRQEDTLSTVAEVGSIPSVQKDVLSQGLAQDQTITELNIEKKQPSPRTEFKIAIQNQNGEINNQLTELTETNSGTLAMELEDNIVELIEEKSKIKPYLYVSLKTTDSGHMLVCFDSQDNVVSATQRVTVRRTPSGTKLIDIHKDFIKKLKQTTSNETDAFNLPKKENLPSSPKTNVSSKQNFTKTAPSIDSSKETSWNPEQKPKRKDIMEPHKEIENIADRQSRESKDVSLTTLSWKSDVPPIEKHSPPSSNKISPLGSSKPEVPNYEEPKIMQAKEVDYIPPLIIIQTDSQEADVNAEEECECPPSPPISFVWKPNFFDRTPLSLTQTDTTKIENIKEKPIQVIVKIPERVSTQVNAPINIQSKEHDCVCPRDVPPLCLKSATNKKGQLNEKTAQISDTGLKEIKPECQWIQDSPTSSFKSATSKSYTSLADTDYIPELTEFYKQGNVNVVVKVRSTNGIVRKLDTVVTRTLSGTLAIYGKDMTALGNISFVEDEHPVLLTKTVSDTYFVGIGQYDRSLNAVLRKTKSGGMLVVPRPKSSQIQSRNRSAYEEFFKVKVTGVRNYPVELPAVLKTTLSENYIIVLDKEFEKRYKQTVQEYVGEKRECLVDLTKSFSGNYVIELDTEDKSHLKMRNALLVKSSSGNIKVLVHGPEFESMVKSVSKKSSTTSSKAFGQLVSKLPASSREFHREHLRKYKFLDKKASSDTQLYEKVRLQLQDHKHLLSEPSAVLKKTASGQYAIILNKESKKAFINNLQSYLTSNSQGLIPIKRTESGEIIIILNSREVAKGRYGSLKITASGNIFVMVDEKTLKGITKDSKKEDKAGVVVACSIDTDLINLNAANKAVTTTCHGIDDCSCDTSKCVCAELQLHAVDWFYNDSAKKCTAIWNKAAVDVIHSADNHCVISNGGMSKDKSPHIVIKPERDCGPPTVKKFRSSEQCFYLFDTCPYHKERYNAVSNELLEITGLCNEKQEEPNRNKYEINANADLPNVNSSHHTWDSLNYLPPQLPSFLRNVRYR